LRESYFGTAPRLISVYPRAATLIGIGTELPAQHSAQRYCQSILTSRPRSKNKNEKQIGHFATARIKAAGAMHDCK
jgi:hypothetical protein